VSKPFCKDDAKLRSRPGSQPALIRQPVAEGIDPTIKRQTLAASVKTNAAARMKGRLGGGWAKKQPSSVRIDLAIGPYQRIVGGGQERSWHRNSGVRRQAR
jgi:hypothetical protein